MSICSNTGIMVYCWNVKQCTKGNFKMTIQEELLAEKKRSAILFDLIGEMLNLSISVKNDLYELYERKAAKKPYSRTVMTLDAADETLSDIAGCEYCAAELMSADPADVLSKWNQTVEEDCEL